MATASSTRFASVRQAAHAASIASSRAGGDGQDFRFAAQRMHAGLVGDRFGAAHGEELRQRARPYAEGVGGLRGPNASPPSSPPRQAASTKQARSSGQFGT